MLHRRYQGGVILTVPSVEGVEASPDDRKPHGDDASRHKIGTADMLQSTMNRFEPRWTFGRRTMVAAAAALSLLVGSGSTFAQQDVNVTVNVQVDLSNAPISSCRRRARGIYGTRVGRFGSPASRSKVCPRT